MPRITKVVRIDRDADTSWRDIGGFGAVGKWHPLLRRSSPRVSAPAGERAGALRTAETRDGMRQVERLLGMEPSSALIAARWNRHPCPVVDYVNELRARDDGGGTSTVVWSCEFRVTSDDEAGATSMIRDFVKAGLDNLKR